MMESIAHEFQEPIFSKHPKKIIDVFELPDHQYWVAINGDKVAGTIGVIQLADGNLVLKSMFVDKVFRGQGISYMLLNHVVDWARKKDCRNIFLGTMSQFIAAQKFYEKNGFAECNRTDLPADFAHNTLDTIFYCKDLR